MRLFEYDKTGNYFGEIILEEIILEEIILE
jgi:hypothetical protein